MNMQTKIVANFCIIKETDEYIIIDDLGPHDLYKSITNSAEWVLKQLLPRLRGRKLYYIDTERMTDQIVYKAGKFIAFNAGGPDGNR